MTEKLNFKPIITRIKLNPEQAVLSCACFSVSLQRATSGTNTTACTVGKIMRSVKTQANTLRS